MSLGKRLAEARKAQELSQVALAKRCGISDSAQLKFEKDENVPGGAYLARLAELGIDVNYVLLGMPGAMTPEEGALLNAFRAADLKVRNELLAKLLMGQSEVTESKASVKAKSIQQVVQGQTIHGDQNNDFSRRRK